VAHGANKTQQFEKIRFSIAYTHVRCEMTLPSAATVTPGFDRFFSVLDPAGLLHTTCLSGCVYKVLAEVETNVRAYLNPRGRVILEKWSYCSGQETPFFMEFKAGVQCSRKVHK
jgi:hypothetical protein